MIYAPTNRRIIRPNDKPSFEHTQRYGLIRGHWANTNRVGLWLMNEGSGNKVQDLSGNKGTGIINEATWISGTHRSALHFDGVNDRIVTTKTYNLTSITVIMKLRTLETIDGGWFSIDIPDGNNADQFTGMRLDAGGEVRATLADGTNYFRRNSLPGGIVQNKWQTVAFTGSAGGYPEIYIDGVNKSDYSDQASSGTPADLDDGVIGIGVGVKDYANVDIEYCYVWGRVFTASEIAQFHREPFLGIEKRAAPVYFFVPTGGQDFIRTINDSIVVSDVTSRVSAINRTFSESMGVTDVDSKVSNTIRTIAESLGIIDVLSKEEDKVISDSLGLTDAVSRVNIFLRTVADSMSITDEVVKVWEVIRLISDSEGITDAYEGVIGQWITIADSLGITDSVTRVIDYLRTQDDDVEITDAIVKVAVALRTIDDSMGITDEMAHELSGLMKAAWAFMVMRQTQN